MFSSRNKKNNAYPCKPQFYYIEVGFKGSTLHRHVFVMIHVREGPENDIQVSQADIIEAFNSTSRYLDDLLNIDNIYFDQMVDRIYPTELQLNRANSSDTEAPFLDLIYVFLTVLFPPKFIINGTILILI